MTEEELAAKVSQDIASHGDLMLLMRLRLLQGKPIGDILSAKADALESSLRARSENPTGPVAGGAGQPAQQINPAGPGGSGGNDKAPG